MSGPFSSSAAPWRALALAAAVTFIACKRDEPRRAPPQPQGQPGAGAPAGVAGPAQRIAALEAATARNPRDAQSWIQLGNEYFDAHQHQKSIDAYSKALEIDPDNPDVLTDQGVMYREMGAHQKAIANFERAHRVAPSHVQSVFNLGVVYGYDLRDAEKAIAAWTRVIEIAPTSPHAAQARRSIEDMKRQPGAPAAR